MTLFRVGLRVLWHSITIGGVNLTMPDKVKNFEIYVYGSILSDEFSVGLSDADIAIVSDEFNDRDKKLEIFGELTHVLSRERWKTYKRFRTFEVVKI